jgi:alginate O-acetyltransferase complex protein AlgI
MVFSSPIFLFLFLPLFLSGYYLLFSPVKFFQTSLIKRFFITASNTFLFASSLLFYFWGEAWLVLIMLTSTVIDYFCGLAIGRSSNSKYRKLFLTLSLVANLSLLAYFKYSNFGIDSFNAIVDTIGFTNWQVNDFIEVVLPLGISFYTFQSMSYTIDVYRKQVSPTRNFFGFACFVTMFPQLVAGPIVRYKDVAAQIVERTINRELFTSGCLRFILGLGKKVLIANTVAMPADKIFAIPVEQLTPGLAWLGITCYTLQIYFDFSGYSDMAIGLGRMLGFTFPENFNYPYFAKSIQEFWRRWHISLSSWFRDYLYIPLGGGRGNPVRVYFNLVLVFLLCGLWHGASWVFVIWGLYHGAFLVVERLGFAKWLDRQWLPIRHVYVILAAMGGWVLFRAETFPQALAFYSALIGFSPGEALQFNVMMYLTGDVVAALIIGAVFSWPIVPWLMEWRAKFHLNLPTYVGHAFHCIYSCVKLTIVLAVFLLSVMSISSGAYNPFIYFRF